MDLGNPYDFVEIPLLDLLRNLAIGLVMAVVWAFFVRRSTRLVVDTSQYLPIFLMLIPTMILIISIIRSSVALSLGLVGALSIVRFRTPIKEPEELLYLFVAIAIGLGLGANQVLPTIVGFTVVVTTMWAFAYNRTKAASSNSYFIDIVIASNERQKFSLSQLTEIMKSHELEAKIKRVVDSESRHEITLQIGELDLGKYEIFKESLRDKYQGVTISIIDNSRVIT